jgi:2-polyprenyl-3-methyl-5-hydroxy-6-metoxy-1,4-benzoquinol methylase
MSERSWPKRHCPVCDSGNSRPLMRYQFAAISDATLLDHYDLVICDECGCGFADDIPPQSHFDDYYRQLSKYENLNRGGVGSLFDAERFRVAADLLVRFIPSPSDRILEIGCATGGFLAELRSRGFANVTGMDPSGACVQAAREVYHLNAFQGTLSEISSHRQTYDFVILLGVVEHLREAGTELASLKNLLSPAGRLLVSVPDTARLNEARNAPFQAFSLEHINYFSPRSLQNLLAMQGFDLVGESRAIVASSATTRDPVVSECFVLVGEPLPIARDDETERAVRQYIDQARAIELRTHEIIARLVDSQRPIIVWGTGAHTLRLLATSRLGEANVRFYVDSNSHYQGRELGGAPVRAPSDISGRPEPILISSWVYQDEIARQLRDDLKLPNERVLLYDF